MKFTITAIIIFFFLVFLAGMYQVVHTMDNLDKTMNKEFERRNQDDRKLKDWSESPTPGGSANGKR